MDEDDLLTPYKEESVETYELKMEASESWVTESSLSGSDNDSEDEFRKASKRARLMLLGVPRRRKPGRPRKPQIEAPVEGPVPESCAEEIQAAPEVVEDIVEGTVPNDGLKRKPGRPPRGEETVNSQKKMLQALKFIIPDGVKRKARPSCMLEDSVLPPEFDPPRKRGRPRIHPVKVRVSHSDGTPRGRGRPRRIFKEGEVYRPRLPRVLKEEVQIPKRPRGRPRVHPIRDPTEIRKRGRKPGPKKKLGRPPKGEEKWRRKLNRFGHFAAIKPAASNKLQLENDAVHELTAQSTVQLVKSTTTTTPKNDADITELTSQSSGQLYGPATTATSLSNTPQEADLKPKKRRGRPPKVQEKWRGTLNGFGELWGFDIPNTSWLENGAVQELTKQEELATTITPIPNTPQEVPKPKNKGGRPRKGQEKWRRSLNGFGELWGLATPNTSWLENSAIRQSTAQSTERSNSALQTTTSEQNVRKVESVQMKAGSETVEKTEKATTKAKPEKAVRNEKWVKPAAVEKLGKVVTKIKVDKLSVKEKLKRPAVTGNLKKPVTKEKLEEFTVEEKPEKAVTKKNLEKAVTKEKLEKPVTQEHLGKVVTEENLEKPATQEELKESTVEEKPGKTVTEENFQGPVTKEKLDKPVSQENLDKDITEENLKKPVMKEKLQKPVAQGNLEKCTAVEKLENLVAEEKPEKAATEEKLTKSTTEKTPVTKHKLDIPVTQENLKTPIVTIATASNVRSREVDENGFAPINLSSSDDDDDN